MLKSKLLRIVFGEKKYQEHLLKCRRMSIVCVNSKERSIIVQDRLKGTINQVCLLKLLGRDFVLYCRDCKTSKCCHSIFAFYCSELTSLCPKLGTIITPGPIISRLNTIKYSLLLKHSLVPAILITIFSPQMLPFFTISGTHIWFGPQTLQRIIENMSSLVAFV